MFRLWCCNVQFTVLFMRVTAVVNVSTVVCSAMNAIHIEVDVQRNAADVWQCTEEIPHRAYLQIHS
jgi:hypothetical protein